MIYKPVNVKKLSAPDFIFYKWLKVKFKWLKRGFDINSLNYNI